MFRKKCSKCKAKVSKSSRFCPNCGYLISNSLSKQENKKDYGILGKEDSQRKYTEDNDLEDMFNPLGAIGGGMLNKMLSGAMKMIEKEMRNMNPEDLGLTNNKNQKIPKRKLQLYINGKKVQMPEEIYQDHIEGHSSSSKKVQKKQKIELPMPSEKTIISSKDLPRIQAKTKITRLPNKLVYEINLPTIKSIENIMIRKLEDGYEVRAYTKKQVLTKTIQLKLALTKYYLQKQKLFLEFQGK